MQTANYVLRKGNECKKSYVYLLTYYQFGYILRQNVIIFNKYQNERHSVVFRLSKFFLGIFVWISVPTYVFINRLFTKITRMFKISLKYVKMHQRALLISFNQHFIYKVLLALHKYFDLKAEAVRHKTAK